LSAQSAKALLARSKATTHKHSFRIIDLFTLQNGVLTSGHRNDAFSYPVLAARNM